MTRDEALLQAIENDLDHYHRQRMARLQGEKMAALLAERAKQNPDTSVIAQLRQAIVQIERDKQDASITMREVVEPLRARVRDRS